MRLMMTEKRDDDVSNEFVAKVRNCFCVEILNKRRRNMR